MPEISLTDFVDFAITTPTSQLTKVRQLVKRGAYDPRFDFWKALREAVQDFHRDGEPLDDVTKGLNDPKKMVRYPQAVKSYKKFLKKQKDVKWFKPPAAIWTFQGLTVRVNPELGLILSSQKYAVKLYFKDEKPTAHRLKIVFAMMKAALKLDGTIPCVVDVSSARLITPKPLDEDLLPLLEAQALAFVHIWKSVAAKAAGA